MASLETAVSHIADRLEPRSLDGVDGQDELVEALWEVIEASRYRDHPLPPVLLIGPKGLGKRSIGAAAARDFVDERGSNICEADAADIDDRDDLHALLTSLRTDDVLLVYDLEELDGHLYDALIDAAQNFYLSPSVDDPDDEQGTPLSFFSLIATTAEDVSVTAIRDWITARVQPYEVEALVEMVQWWALRLGVTITDRAAERLAIRSGARPRRLRELLARVFLEHAEELSRDDRWLIDEHLLGDVLE